ncbi:hypothetical protein FB562_1882 [Homoserinimonas aerilata]|uniref:Uncharacterized protein n=1 Tax=Homoserinimonas aerilata TaxID=1162970 RepID=A0A542YL06_9MICO|nr:hypothetical protein [Homoserinimonas aerilata]TQL48776.1 hypothetical protein FB562_1882 [Homoserinimonas aerilata]
MSEKQYSGHLSPLRPEAIVELAPGLRAMLPWYFSTEDTEGYDVELALDADETGKLTTESITVRRRAGGRPVDGAGLRSIRVAELFQAAASNAVQLADANDGENKMSLDPVALLANHAAHSINTENPRIAGPGGSLNDEMLKAVATLFKAAEVSGLPPQKYVMDALEVPRSTAGYWIAQARKRGHLPPSSRSGVSK